MMLMSLDEFWKIFVSTIKDTKTKDGYNMLKISHECGLPVPLIQTFLQGPLLNIEYEIKKLNKDNKMNAKVKQRKQKRLKVIQQKLQKKWEHLIKFDQDNNEFRHKLATFIVKYLNKQSKNKRN